MLTVGQTSARQQALGIVRFANRIPRTALVGILVAVIVLGSHLATLLRFPPQFVDEAWMASRAWAWLDTGLNYGPLDVGSFPQLDGYWTFLPILPTLIHAPVVRVFGVDLFWLRMASLLAGVGLLAAVYALVRVLASHRAGLLAAFLLATSYPFALSAHWVRPDIYVAALGIGSLALWAVASRRNSTALALGAGIALGLAFEIHMNAVIYGPPLLALVLMTDGLRVVKTRRFRALVLGGAVALAWYAWYHVLRYPDTYWAMGAELGATHRPPIFDPDAMVTALREMLSFLLVASLFRNVALLIAIPSLLLRHSVEGRRTALMFVVCAVAFALAIRAKLNYYAILIAPFSAMCLGVWLCEVVSHPPLAFWAKRAKALGVALLVGTALATVYVTVSAPPVGEAHSVARRVQALVSDDDTVMGPHTYWLELAGHPYVTWHAIRQQLRIAEPGHSVSEAMSVLRPDLFVVDDDVRGFFWPADRPEPRSGIERYVWERSLPREDMVAFLTCRGVLEDSIETAAYGRVDIYSMRWDSSLDSCP